MDNKDNSWIQHLIKLTNMNSLKGIFTFGVISFFVISSLFYLVISGKRQESIQEIRKIVQQRDEVISLHKKISEDLHKSLNGNLLYKFSGKELYRFQSFYTLNVARQDFSKLYNTASEMISDKKLGDDLTEIKTLINEYDKVMSESLNKDGQLQDVLNILQEGEKSGQYVPDSLDSAINQASKAVSLTNEELSKLKDSDQLIRMAELHLLDIDNLLANVVTVIQLNTLGEMEVMANKKQFLPYFIFSVILIGIFLLIARRINTYISSSIKESSIILDSVAKGELPDNKVELKKEFSRISKANNKLISYLNEANLFARKIGDGEFDLEFKSKGKKDALGNSLIEMRDRLLEVTKEDKVRNWINEGQAKFGEILRVQTDSIRDLGDSLISNLVEYIGANQGAIFTMNQDNEVDIYLELLSSYAFKRKKFINKRIEPGEGLVGQVFLEGKTRYLTEVREDHFEITTGLGESKPSCLLIVPMKEDETVEGIIEIASYNPIPEYQVEFVENIATSIAASIRIGKINLRTKTLLAESQEKAEEMKAQEEELRQNMEELAATHEQMERRNMEMETLQEKLKKEQYLLNALLNNTPDAIYFKDKESKFIRLSKSLALKFGEESSEDVVGKSDFDYFEGEGTHAQDAFEDEQRIISTGIPIIDKVEKETFDNGRLHWVSTTKNPLRDEEGLVIGTFGISRDITKSKLAELEVLKQKNWIEYYFKHNSVTFIVLDQFGKINYASAGLLNKLGRIKYDDLTYTDIFIDPTLSKYIDALNVGGNVNKEIELEFVLNNTAMTKARYHCFANPEVNEDGTRNLFILEKMSE